jgi:hypothetical protein
MRLALCCVLLVTPACFSIEWHVPVFATNLTPSNARHLMFWPSDGTGDSWRHAIGTREIPAFELSPAEPWPLAPLEVEGPIDEVVAFIPRGAPAGLTARAVELLAGARERWPDAATHLRPTNLDYAEAVSPRLLYAQLLGRALARDEDPGEEEIAPLFAQYRFGFAVDIDIQPNWAVVPSEGPDGVRWSTLRSHGRRLVLESRGLRAEQALAAMLADLPAPEPPVFGRWAVILVPGERSWRLSAAIENFENGLLEASDAPFAVLRAEANAEWFTDLERTAAAMSPFQWQEVTSGEIELRGRWRSPGGMQLAWTASKPRDQVERSARAPRSSEPTVPE